VSWQDDPALDDVTVPVAAFLKHGFRLVTPGQIEAGALPELPVLTDWVAKRLFRDQWGRVEVIRGAMIGLGHVTPPA